MLKIFDAKYIMRLMREWILLKALDSLFDVVWGIYLAKATIYAMIFFGGLNFLHIILDYQVATWNTPPKEWTPPVWTNFLVIYLITSSFVVIVLLMLKKAFMKNKKRFDYIVTGQIKWRYNTYDGECSYVPYCIVHEIKLQDEYSAGRIEKLLHCLECKKSIKIQKREYDNHRKRVELELDKMFPS